MDAALKGHAYVKSGIDMACWDILGKVTGQPVCILLGGRYGDDFALYRAISQESPAAMAQRVAQYRTEGYTRFQLKVGGDADTDIERIRAVRALLQPGDRLIADANTGWLMHDALRVVRAVRDVDVYIEQPCLSYEECLSIRWHCDHPFIIDEVMFDRHIAGAVPTARGSSTQDSAGGLTKTVSSEPVRVAGRRDDAGKTRAASSAIAISHPTPPEFLFTRRISAATSPSASPTARGASMAGEPGLGVTHGFWGIGDVR